MKKFDNSQIIHTLNKNVKSNLQEEISDLKNREYKILLGDLCEDINMIPKDMWENTIKIGILNKNIEENLDIYRKSFDIVITDNDANFTVLNEIIKD